MWLFRNFVGFSRENVGFPTGKRTALQSET